MMNCMKLVTMALVLMFTFYSQLKALSHLNLNNPSNSEHDHSIDAVSNSSFLSYFLTGEHKHEHDHNDHNDDQEASPHSHSHQHTASSQFYSSDFIQNEYSFKISVLESIWPSPNSKFLSHHFQFEILRPPINLYKIS